MRIKRRKYQGFTILEMLVTISILLMVIGLLASSFFFIVRSSTSTRMMVYENREAMKVYAQMRQQLLSYYRAPYKTNALQGTKGPGEAEDEIFFMTAASIYSSGVSQVGYSIQEDDQQNKYLAYAELPYGLKEEYSEPEWIPLSKFITGLTIKYYEKDVPNDNWEKPELPTKIEVTLVFANQKDLTFFAVPGIISW